MFYRVMLYCSAFRRRTKMAGSATFAVGLLTGLLFCALCPLDAQSVVISGPRIVDTADVTLTTGEPETVHRFAFACILNLPSPPPNGTSIDVTFKFEFPYPYDETNLTKSTIAPTEEVFLYEEELAPYFGSKISCCYSYGVLSENCSTNSYFAGFMVSAGYEGGDLGNDKPREKRSLSVNAPAEDRFPPQRIFHSRCQQERPANLSLIATVPLSCWHYTMQPGNRPCQYHPMIRDNILLSHDCPSIITNGSCSTLLFEATRYPGNAAYDIGISFQPFPPEAGGSFLDHYQIPGFNLTVSDSCSERTCRSTGDPHVSTYDGKNYDFYGVGEYMMSKVRDPSGRLVLEVHGRTQSCGSVSCHCGVIAREGNTVMGVDACSGNRMDITYLDDPNAPGATISQPNGPSSYAIMLPSGASIRGNVYGSYMNIYIDIPGYFSPADGYMITGLCGNANGDGLDDVLPDDGSLDPLGSTQPLSFYESHRLELNESFFDFANIECRPDVVYTSISGGGSRHCGCAVDGTTAVCDVTPPVTTRTTGASCDNVAQNPGRKKRQASQVEDNYISPEELNYEFNILPPLTSPVLHFDWPTPSGITESEATDQCMGAIMTSPLYAYCPEHVNRALAMCVYDYGATGMSVFVNNAGQLFAEMCITYAAQSTPLVGPDPAVTYDVTTSTLMTGTPLLLNLLSCPNMCSNQGICHSQGCSCNNGFGGVDCSVDLSQPSTLSGLQYGGLCDVRQYPCRNIYVYATNLVTLDLQCNTTYWQNGVAMPQATPAIIVSAGTVICSLPLSPSDIPATSILYEISLFGGDRSTDRLQLTVYDSHCLSCDANQQCAVQNNTCEIDGVCYSYMTQHPTNPCLVCDPSSSATTWTPEFSPNPQQDVDLYKFNGLSLTHTFSPSGGAGLPLAYSFPHGSVDGLMLTTDGVLTWLATDNTIHSGVIVHAQQVPCGFSADISVNLTVLPCLCQNEGTCMQGPGPTGLLFVCQCATGFTGVLCEIPEQTPWSPWSEWSNCDPMTCIRRRDRTCQIAPCTGVSFQLECCPGCYSTEDVSEQHEGVIITFTSATAMNTVLANAETGYGRIAEAVNSYCAANARACCQSLDISYGGGSFVMTSWNSIRIAAGYSDCDHRIKFLVVVQRSDAQASCGGTAAGRKKRAVGDEYVGSDILLAAIDGTIDQLELAFDGEIESTEAAPTAPPTSDQLTTMLVAGLVPLAVLIIIVIIAACLARRRGRRGNGSRLKNDSWRYGGFWGRGYRHRNNYWYDSDHVRAYEQPYYSYPRSNSRYGRYY